MTSPTPTRSTLSYNAAAQLSGQTRFRVVCSSGVGGLWGQLGVEKIVHFFLFGFWDLFVLVEGGWTMSFGHNQLDQIMPFFS